jgi:hypothetical protein
MRAFDATEMSRILATVQALPREAQSVPKRGARQPVASKNGAGASKPAGRTRAKAGARRR